MMCSKEAHDYRDIATEYHTRISNVAFAEGDEEDLRLLLSEDRKRRRANNNSDGPKHIMDLHSENFSNQNTTKGNTLQDENIPQNQNSSLNHTESSFNKQHVLVIRPAENHDHLELEVSRAWPYSNSSKSP